MNNKKQKLILFLVLILSILSVYSQTNFPIAILQWEVYGLQIYRIDIKTNISDEWYPYGVVAMCGSYLGMDAQSRPIYSIITSNMHQPVSIEIPVNPNQCYFRVYTLPENTNGATWPTTNSRPVIFKVIPPKIIQSTNC